jgi:hypothetical protein
VRPIQPADHGHQRATPRVHSSAGRHPPPHPRYHTRPPLPLRPAPVGAGINPVPARTVSIAPPTTAFTSPLGAAQASFPQTNRRRRSQPERPASPNSRSLP